MATRENDGREAGFMSNIQKDPDTGLWRLVSEEAGIPVEIETFDTQLRDGEQGGITYTSDAKKKIAEYLADSGISTIEVGFPSSNQMEFDTVKEIADTVDGPYICGLTTMHHPNIERTWDALKNNSNPTIHIFTQNIDEASVRAYCQNPDDQIRIASEAVAFAKELMQGRGRVEFSAQNTILALYQSLSEEYSFLQDFIAGMYSGAIRNGADVVNIPHTVAKGIGINIQDAIRYFKALVPGTDKVKLSFHAHNDFGLGLSDTLAAIEEGVQQVEGTWYNCGERSGNTALEQVIANIRFNPNYNKRFFTRFDASRLCSAMRLIEKETGMQIPYNAPFGPNAFAHGSGSHQDGDEKGRKIGELIYLPCDPGDVGWTGITHKITKLTGKSGVYARFREMGYDFTKEFVAEFIVPIIKSQDITYRDVDLRLIGDGFRYGGREHIEFLGFAFSKFLNSDTYVAQPQVRVAGEERIGEQVVSHVGSIDSLFGSIDNVLDLGDDRPDLVIYEPRNTGKTHKSEAEAIVVLSSNGSDISYHVHEPVWVGKGNHSDTMTASAIAYVQALSRYVADSKEE